MRLRAACATKLLPLMLLALSPVLQAQYTYTTTNGKVTITGYTGSGGEVSIPTTINGLPLTGIAYRAFANSTSLASVTIPDSVTSIGDEAFNGCSRLASALIGNGVTSIGSYVFAGCTRLDSLTVGSSVTSIGFRALYGCTSLKAITVPDSVASIGEQAFNGCTGLISLALGNGVTTIGISAFINCTGLASVKVPDSVIRIGDGAFNGCTGLASITIGSSVNSIGYRAFINCTSLASVNIPDSVISIGDEAFNGCTRLASVAIGNSVTSIGSYVFVDCTSLASVTIGSNVTSIGYRAFINCPSLASLTIPSNVTSIGEQAFNGCTGLTSVTIGKSVTSIGVSAFINCTGLATVVIPDSVTSIGDGAFNGCTGLASVRIGNNVTSIGYRAFINCTSLASVTIPDSVTIIGDEAFNGCTRLASVLIGNGLTSIGNYVFVDCTRLASVRIGSNVTSIGYRAFINCTSLSSITIPNTVSTIREQAFNGCTGLTSVVIGNRVTSIGVNAFINCTRLAGITIPDSVTSIGDGAFNGCARLTTAVIGNSVTSIGFGAFINCSRLGSVTIGRNVTSIGGAAFKGCASLTSVTIPDSATSIGDEAFNGCTSLASVLIGNNVTSIGRYAFYSCAGLSTVTIGSNVTHIGAAAFMNCTALARITIPDSVTSIGDSAFSGCTNLTGIYFKGIDPDIGSSVFYGDNKATVYYLAATSAWGSTFGGLPTRVWNLPPDPIISNVRVNQRPGTKLVDIYYDASGVAGSFAITAAISTDGGNSYSLVAASFSGDGYGPGVLPGSNRHVVWDAGADYPGKFSTQMRLKVILGSSFVVSPIFTLDTRTISTGTLTGTVRGNGAPLGNAQVRIDGTSFATTTTSSGTFALANVPVGSGYLLRVSAAGFAGKSVAGIKVTAGSTDCGIIQLASTGGPYRLVPLQPDVNPPVTRMETGGVAYRYYCVLAADGKTPAGGINVALRLAGSSPIPQSGDTSAYWPGSVAGVSDHNGIVRLRIPSSALGAAGASATLEAVESGTVKQTFTAQVVPRQYDQVWKHRLGVGGTLGEGALDVGANVSPQSEVRRRIVGGTATSESISRLNTTQVQAGAGAGVDVGLSLKTTSLKFSGAAGLSLSADDFVSVQAGSTYAFDPTSTDPAQNAMKLYVDLGNVLTTAPGLGAPFYNWVQTTLEASFLGPCLASVQGAVAVGGEAQGQAGFQIGGGQQFQLAARASGSISAEGITGFEQRLGLGRESALISGIAGSGSLLASLGASSDIAAAVQQASGNSLYLPSFFPDESSDVQLLLKSWTQQGGKSPYRWEVKGKMSLAAGAQVPVASWQQYDPGQLYTNYRREFTETWERGTESSLNTYERSIYAAQQDLGLNLNLDLSLFGGDLQGEVDRAAEVVNERGFISQSRHWPVEAYPAITTGLLPSDSWFSLLSQWTRYAAGPIGQALNQSVTTVAKEARTVIQAGSDAAHGMLEFGEGVMDAGSAVVAKWASSLFGSGSAPHFALAYDYRGRQLQSSPPTHLVYGIGGIYRFESTNSFHGTGTLTIAYSPAEVAGLNQADLRIYHLPDGTNRWQLVGSTVNMASNTVTARVTTLGTYAVAPPMPTGDLQLVPSTNALAADGVSQMTIIVSNLMLNTGNSATQQWAFTAMADGVTIVNPDLDAAAPRVQLMSTNGALTLLLRAPQGGRTAHVSLASAFGDAYGATAINLMDSDPPATPTNVTVTAGQSRVWVSWQTNGEPDLAGYRVYYRMGQSGPPWDGTASVEGAPSPIQVAGTNALLVGLTSGTNYFVAVSAVDTPGNESPLSAAVEVATAQTVPSGPTAVVAKFGADGTNVLMWALSDDDGYNDRDVARYEIWRAVLPGGDFLKVGDVPAGIGVYSEQSPSLTETQYVRYTVSAVATNGQTSPQILANYLLPDGVGIAQPPTILSQPQSHTVLSGASVNFTVSAGGTPPPVYQWQFNGANIIGATNTTLILANVTTNQAGVYNITASNLAGGVTSSNAVLTVLTQQIAAASLSNAKVTGTTFTVSASTQTGRNYVFESKNTLSDPQWTPVQTLPGTGGTVTFADTVATAPSRYYRVRVEQ